MNLDHRHSSLAIAFAAGIATGYGVKCYLTQQKNALICRSRNKKTTEDEGTQVVYAVDVTIENSAVPSFKQWMPGHVQELLALPGFKDAKYYKKSLPTVHEKPTVIFVLGGPGAGKGTQCEKIVTHFQYVHISAGDCLRAERNSQSADAKLINQYIQDGKIVPVEITVRLLKKAMDASGKSKFLIDGFPRNVNNVEGWYDTIGDSVDVSFVLFLDCPEEVMEKRLLERGKTSGRIDDNMESIKKRFNTYAKETKPIIDLFAQKGKVRHVVADASINEVWLRVKKHVASVQKPIVTTQDFTIQYHLASDADLKRYVKEFAPKMRVQGVEKFKDKMSINRTYLHRLTL